MNFEDVASWKSDLQSKSKGSQLGVLQDIAEKLNREENEKSQILRIINSDISYFLSELLIYQRKSQTNLVIKVALLLSETREFFKHDFFRYLRSGLRLVNSFHGKSNEIEEVAYKRSILSFITTLLRRAQINHVSFIDERISKVSLVIAASSLKCINSEELEKLDFINATLEVLTNIEVIHHEKIYRDKKLLEIIKNVNFKSSDLSNVDFSTSLCNILQTATCFVSTPIQSAEEESILDLITEKLMIIMKFFLCDSKNLPKISYEMSLNLFFYMYKSSALSSVRYKILNRFLSYNGLNFLLFLANRKDESAIGRLIAFKSRVVISEIMLHILKIFHKDDNSVYDDEILREKYLEIVLKCDFNSQSVEFENIAELSRESLMFVIFKYFIMLRWNNARKTRGELLSSMAFILEVFKARKIPLDKALASIVFNIYTTNFVQISIKDNTLLENSSATLLKYVGRINIIVDVNFFKWWLIHNPRDRATYEKLLDYMLSSKSTEEFSNLCEDDLFAFDLKYLLNTFLDEKAPLESIVKVTRIISHFTLNLRDIGKILTFCEKQKNAKDRFRSMYALKILCVNYEKLNVRLRNSYCDLAVKILNSSENLQERMLAVQLLSNLIHTEIGKQ